MFARPEIDIKPGDIYIPFWLNFNQRQQMD